MPLTDEESLLCEEEQEDEFDLTEIVIHQADLFDVGLEENWDTSYTV